jgi:hypothetical protein
MRCRTRDTPAWTGRSGAWSRLYYRPFPTRDRSSHEFALKERPLPSNLVDDHILQVMRTHHDVLVREATDIVFASGEASVDRSTVEQLLRGNMAIIAESLLGESTDLRRMYLDVALPEVARSGTSTWRTVLRDGLPCWGIIVGQIAVRASETHRQDVIVRLSRLMGVWWAEVWDSMSPVYRSTGSL